MKEKKPTINDDVKLSASDELVAKQIGELSEKVAVLTLHVNAINEALNSMVKELFNPKELPSVPVVSSNRIN